MSLGVCSDHQAALLCHAGDGEGHRLTRDWSLLLEDLQKPPGCDAEQPALGAPALEQMGTWIPFHLSRSMLNTGKTSCEAALNSGP